MTSLFENLTTEPSPREVWGFDGLLFASFQIDSLVPAQSISQWHRRKHRSRAGLLDGWEGCLK